MTWEVHLLQTLQTKFQGILRIWKQILKISKPFYGKVIQREGPRFEMSNALRSFHSITSTFQLPFGFFWYETKLINPSRILTSAGILVDLKQEFHIKLPDMWSCISWLKQSPKYENETNQTIWSVSVDWNELTRVPRSLIEATKGGGVFLLPRILNCLAVNQQLAYFFLGQSMRGIRRCRSGPNPSLAALAMSFFFFEIRVT